MAKNEAPVGRRRFSVVSRESHFEPTIYEGLRWEPLKPLTFRWLVFSMNTAFVHAEGVQKVILNQLSPRFLTGATALFKKTLFATKMGKLSLGLVSPMGERREQILSPMEERRPGVAGWVLKAPGLGLKALLRYLVTSGRKVIDFSRFLPHPRTEGPRDRLAGLGLATFF